MSPACQISNDAIPPPSDGSESATRGVVEPKPQATSLNRAENERLRVKRSAFWAPTSATAWGPVSRSRLLEGPTPHDVLQLASLGGMPLALWGSSSG